MSVVFTYFKPYDSSQWHCATMLQNGRVGEGWGSTKEEAAKEAARRAGDGSSSSDDVTECTLEPYGGFINSWYSTVKRKSGRTGSGYGQSLTEALNKAFRNAGG